MQSFKTLSDYDVLDVPAWATWLRERIEMIYSPDVEQRRRALDFTDEIAMEPQEPVVALCGFARHLHPPTATRMRRALGDALLQAHPQWIGPEGMALLVILVGQLQAHEAALAMVDALIEGEVWGRRHPSLLADALSVLKTLGRSPAAAEAAAKLAQSPELPPVLLFDAYQALLAGSSTRWGQWFVELSPLLATVRNHVPPRRPLPAGEWFDQRLQRLALVSISRLALPVIVDGLRQLQGGQNLDPTGQAELARSRFGKREPAGRLLRALFVNDGAPMALQTDAEGNTRLCSQHAPVHSVPWPEDELAYLYAHVQRARASVKPKLEARYDNVDPAIESARNEDIRRQVEAMMAQNGHRRVGSEA